MPRFEVNYSGHVQGVGFRYNALMVSRGFAVTGTVQNLSDGQVKLVVESDRETAEEFIQTVAQTTHGHVSRISVTESKATGEFRTFEILR